MPILRRPATPHPTQYGECTHSVPHPFFSQSMLPGLALFLPHLPGDHRALRQRSLQEGAEAVCQKSHGSNPVTKCVGLTITSSAMFYQSASTLLICYPPPPPPKLSSFLVRSVSSLFTSSSFFYVFLFWVILVYYLKGILLELYTTNVLLYYNSLSPVLMN